VLRAKDWQCHYHDGHYSEDPYTHQDSEIAAAKTQKRQRNEPQTENNKYLAAKTGAYHRSPRPPTPARAEANSYGRKPADGTPVGDASVHGVGEMSAAEHATNLAVHRAPRKFAPAIVRTKEPPPYPIMDPEAIAQAATTGLTIQTPRVNHDAIGTTDTACSRNCAGHIADQSMEVLRMTAFFQDPGYWKSRNQQHREYKMRMLAVREKEADVTRMRAEAMLICSKEKSDKAPTV
jgi:hypothetical protein